MTAALPQKRPPLASRQSRATPDVPHPAPFADVLCRLQRDICSKFRIGVRGFATHVQRSCAAQLCHAASGIAAASYRTCVQCLHFSIEHLCNVYAHCSKQLALRPSCSEAGGNLPSTMLRLLAASGCITRAHALQPGCNCSALGWIGMQTCALPGVTLQAQHSQGHSQPSGCQPEVPHAGV